MKKVIAWIVSCLTVLFFILSISIIIIALNAAKNNEAPKILGYNISVVVTKSMTPTIEVGDVVISKTTKTENLKENDIIVFQSTEGETEGLFIVHRIIEVNIDDSNNTYFTTKGDFNDHEDKEKVTEDKIVGKVVFYSSFLGGAVNIIKVKNIAALGLILMFLSMALFEGFKVYQSFKTSKRAKAKAKEIDEMRKEILEELKDEMKKK